MPPTLPSRLSPPDLAIVAFYLIAITLFGLRFSRKSKSAPGSKQEKSLKSYFLADNSIPWWAIALSIVSAETSTLTIISIPGVAFAGDLGFLQVVLGYMLGRIVVALLFLPKYFRGEMLTAYQLIDRRFGPVLHKLTAGLFLLTRAAAEGVRVFAISIVVGLAIGTRDILSIAIISALTLLYTFEGGLAAVIWTDVVQMALYVAGTLVAIFTLGHQIPGGWHTIHAVAAPLGKFHWLNFTLNLTTTYTFWAGLLGGTFLTMASHGTDQLMVQRLLAARNLRESRLALLSSGAVIFLQFTLFLLIGVGLFVFYGQHPQTFTSPDRIFPTFIVHGMPHGVAGLLVAAILAAAMSNLSAALNSLASTTVIDFYLPLRAHLTNKENRVILSEAASQSHRDAAQSKDPNDLRPTSEARPLSPTNSRAISRLSTIFWALVLFTIAVYAIQHGGKGHVVETGLSIASVAYGCLLGVFLLGTLTRYATQTGAILGMIAGLALNLILWLLPTSSDSGWTYTTPTATHYVPWSSLHIAFTWYVLIGSLATFAIGTLFSLLLPRRKPAAALLTLTLLCLSSLCPSCLSFRSEAQESASALAVARSPLALRKSEVILTGASQSYRKAQWRDPRISPLPLSVLPQPQAPDFTPASHLIQEAIAAHHLPGAVLLVGHNGHIVFEGAYGNRALEPTIEPMTTDTIFDLASLTKVLVTTTAILQLYEQGKLDLDTPLAHYLPAFTAESTSETRVPHPHDSLTVVRVGLGRRPTFPEPPAPPQPPQAAYKSQITIRQLLTHYSGLPEDVSLKDDWGLAAPDKPEGLRRAVAAIPYGPPAQTFKYSDINFILLGALVEKLTGIELWKYASKEVFSPLNMGETSYRPFKKVCVGPPKTTHTRYGDLPSPTQLDEDLACGFWAHLDRIAPTAHDDQGTALTNPNFDHLLRGTVHDPTTRRMGGVAGHAGLFSTAEDTAKFCQALLDKLLKNTGPFPLTQATLRLATSPQEPPTAVRTATVFLPDGTTTTGPASRGLGWDLNSPYSRPRGTIFPITTRTTPGSFGHTGFTGTSIWIDPTSDTYVILLANAVHPRGNPPISTLRGQVATAVAQALGRLSPYCQPCPDLTVCDCVTIPVGPSRKMEDTSAAPPMSVISTEATQSHRVAQWRDPRISSLPLPLLVPASAYRYPKASALGLSPAPEEKELQPLGYALPAQATSQTQTGIDVLESTNFEALTTLAAQQGHPLKLGLLTNQAGIDSQGRRTIDILLEASKENPLLQLTTLFTPEHGLRAQQDTEHLQKEEDPATHLPVISLYGPKSSDKHPRQSDLRALDALVIDLQDIGARFWTYETLVGYILESAAKAHVPVFLLDRPNPIGGLAVQGPTSDPGFESYIDFMPLPLRHGLTLGELARYFNANAIEVPLDPTLLDASAVDIGIPNRRLQAPATLPGLRAQLTVIPMQNWTRSQYFTSTKLPWTPPSPNMRTPATAIVYPGVALLEFNPISVGRGTPAPYENIGAPWIKAADLAAYLHARQIPGIQINPASLDIAETPEHYPFHNQRIPGLHFTVTDPTLFDSPEFGLELLAALHHLYPADFHLARCKPLLLNAATLEALKRGQDPRNIAASWQPALTRFKQARKPYLLYP